MVQLHILTAEEKALLGLVLPELATSQAMAQMRGLSKANILSRLCSTLLKMMAKLVPLVLVFESCQWMDDDSWNLT